MEQRVEQLKSLMESYTDYGPVLDCIVFHDGDTWLAAVDVTGTGNFSENNRIYLFLE